MKNAPIRPLLDLPDDIATEIVMICTCCAIAIAALVYLVVV